jgi:CRISPR-associated protein Cas1
MQTLEINDNSAYITVSKGFLVIERQHATDKIPIDEIESLVINSYGATISSQALQKLCEQNAVIIHCGRNAMPVGMTVAYGNHTYRKPRIQNQLYCSLPLKKRLWQETIKAKITNQAEVLKLCNQEEKELFYLAEQVRSGDEGNAEAIASKKYWGKLFGENFRRDPNLPGQNGFLNYGYAILRAAVCRSIIAAGLLPELGMFHRNQKNAFCLADDLMEPFRPFIDLTVSLLSLSEKEELAPFHKKIFIHLLDLQIFHVGKSFHLRYCIDNTIQSYVISLDNKKSCISYPLLSQTEKAKIQCMISEFL